MATRRKAFQCLQAGLYRMVRQAGPEFQAGPGRRRMASPEFQACLEPRVNRESPVVLATTVYPGSLEAFLVVYLESLDHRGNLELPENKAHRRRRLHRRRVSPRAFPLDDGTPLDYTKWDKGQPSNIFFNPKELYNEHCEFIQIEHHMTHPYTWDDAGCRNRIRQPYGVCQIVLGGSGR